MTVVVLAVEVVEVEAAVAEVEVTAVEVEVAVVEIAVIKVVMLKILGMAPTCQSYETVSIAFFVYHCSLNKFFILYCYCSIRRQLYGTSHSASRTS